MGYYRAWINSTKYVNEISKDLVNEFNGPKDENDYNDELIYHYFLSGLDNYKIVEIFNKFIDYNNDNWYIEWDHTGVIGVSNNITYNKRFDVIEAIEYDSHGFRDLEDKTDLDIYTINYYDKQWNNISKQLIRKLKLKKIAGEDINLIENSNYYKDRKNNINFLIEQSELF